MLEAIQALDEAALLFIQENIRFGFLNSVMVFFTTLGNSGAVWIAISLVLICIKKYRRAGVTVLITMGLCWCLNDLVLKELVARPRPFMTIEGLQTLIAFPGSNSFPSGHACSSFSAAYVLARELGKKGSYSYILAAIIALSRPYVGVHYVTDIITGAIIGTLGSIVIYSFLYNKIYKCKNFYTEDGEK